MSDQIFKDRLSLINQTVFAADKIYIDDQQFLRVQPSELCFIKVSLNLVVYCQTGRRRRLNSPLLSF